MFLVSILIFPSSAITGTYRKEAENITLICRAQAWWGRFIFDYRVKAESWAMWLAFVYLRFLQILGRAPPLEKVKSFMESEEKKYVNLIYKSIEYLTHLQAVTVVLM